MNYDDFHFHVYNRWKTRIFFDFDIKNETWNIKKVTFRSGRSLISYLDWNPDLEIYFTLDKTSNFQIDGNKILVNYNKFDSFCSNIWKSWEDKVNAFFSRWTKTIDTAEIIEKYKILTWEEQKDFLENLNLSYKDFQNFNNDVEGNILDIIKSLDNSKQQEILDFLKWTIDIDEKINFRKNADGIFIELWNIENKDIVKEQLKKLEENEFKNIENALNISRIEAAIQVWEENKSNPKEVAFWQKFLKANPWILSQVFAAPFALLDDEFFVWWHYSWSRSGSKNTDFWYKNIFSWNTAIVEIKTPTTELVSPNQYWTRKGIYPMSDSLMWSISQVLNQKDLLQKDYLHNNASKDFKVWNPKIILIIWSEEYKALNTEQRACFELFKNSNKDIEIITFDELFEKIKLLKQIY